VNPRLRRIRWDEPQQTGLAEYAFVVFAKARDGCLCSRIAAKREDVKCLLDTRLGRFVEFGRKEVV
jgi:hypothetical protein